MPVSAKPSVVVIVWDGLCALQLGPYGNAAARTPCWNRLAAESLLIEYAWADTLDLCDLFTAFVTGQPAYKSTAADRPPLTTICQQQGLQSRLITDEEGLVGHAAAQGFEDVILLEGEDRDEPVASIDETALQYFAAEAAEALTVNAELTWIHARGLLRAWDAPLDLRASFADEDDPEPSYVVAPPELQLPDDPDPDVIWGVQQAYAAQLCVADAALEILLHVIDQTRPEALVIVTAARGYALGAHGWIGAGRPPLFGEQLHVPCLLKFPDRRAAGARVPAISQPSAVYATVADWLTRGPEAGAGDSPLLRHARQLVEVDADRAISVSDSERCIRTAQWFLRETTGARPAVELFVKPDDRWEQNEIASRCPDEVRQLQELLASELT